MVLLFTPFPSLSSLPLLSLHYPFLLHHFFTPSIPLYSPFNTPLPSLPSIPAFPSPPSPSPLYPFPPLPRSQLVLSESLARQSPRSPYRRAPSAFVPYSVGAEPLPAAHLSFEEETIDDVLKAAKQDIAKMHKHLHKKRVSLYLCN